jgi:hypothetical protein
LLLTLFLYGAPKCYTSVRIPVATLPSSISVLDRSLNSNSSPQLRSNLLLLLNCSGSAGSVRRKCWARVFTPWLSRKTGPYRKPRPSSLPKQSGAMNESLYAYAWSSPLSLTIRFFISARAALTCLGPVPPITSWHSRTCFSSIAE